MWREEFGWAIAGIVMPWLAASIVVALLFENGDLAPVEALGVSAAALALAVLAAVISQRMLRSAARRAIVGLGPGAAAADRPPGLSRSVRAIRQAVLRLNRAWQDHAAEIEARLAAAEAIIAAVPDPLILIDRQRRIVRANSAAAAFIGAGAAPRDLAAALRNPLLLAAADSVLAGDAARGVEFTLSVPIERVLRAHVARIADRPDHAPALAGAAAILILHDVTELKRSEQMRADFVANAGHELKTPLATLIGFIETLRGPARDDAAAHDRFLGIMGEQARRMARLVDDLLSLSRIELNEHVAPTGRVVLAPVIDEVARGFELRAAARDIRILRTLSADLPQVLGDRDQLAQIFQNLLDNAVKYARPHSEVTVSGTVGSGAAASQVRVAVTDQGDGIASEHLPRLTERFYRVDTARSRELGGTGLGLAIVKHILNRHRGRLEIASTVGQGSTFTVWLRAAEPP
ncbi:MAG TPA: ATP-binding protein [Stellaceae bacterium]|nr:ATP-binding protein [Stellaceae bacterium]